MNDGFKQRLVGAIVLVLLLLIAWPVIFSDGLYTAVDRRSQIEPTPSFEKYTVAQPTHPSNIAAIVKPGAKTVAELEAEYGAGEPVAKPITKERPRLDEKRLPVSWVLQVASFTQPKNAEELKQTLLKQGYKAYTRTISTNDGPSTRVYVGPRLTKQAFADDKLAIDKAFSVNSLVIRFEQ